MTKTMILIAILASWTSPASAWSWSKPDTTGQAAGRKVAELTELVQQQQQIIVGLLGAQEAARRASVKIDTIGKEQLQARYPGTWGKPQDPRSFIAMPGNPASVSGLGYRSQDHIYNDNPPPKPTQPWQSMTCWERYLDFCKVNNKAVADYESWYPCAK